MKRMINLTNPLIIDKKTVASTGYKGYKIEVEAKFEQQAGKVNSKKRPLLIHKVTLSSSINGNYSDKTSFTFNSEDNPEKVAGVVKNSIDQLLEKEKEKIDRHIQDQLITNMLPNLDYLSHNSLINVESIFTPKPKVETVSKSEEILEDIMGSVMTSLGMEGLDIKKMLEDADPEIKKQWKEAKEEFETLMKAYKSFK